MSSVIELKPLTRVEGHGVARIYLDGSNVEKVELALTEPPRLFEALLQGKHFSEIPDIICRICSLCSTIHRVTALMAVENAMGIEVSQESHLYRELIVYGGHIQSHALHLFCLALPDYFQAAGFADLAACKPDLLKLGLRIKAVGNLIQETVGGRLIHPVNVRLGGIGKKLNSKQLYTLQQGIRSILPDTIHAAELFTSMELSDQLLPRTRYMAIKGKGPCPFFGDVLITSTGASFSDSDYKAAFHEEVIKHSHAKVSSIFGQAVTVGALARLNMSMPLTTEAKRASVKAEDKISQGSIWGNNIAQAVELILAVELSLQVIELLLQGELQSFTSAETTLGKVSGVAATEAPRGILIHDYSFDNKGFCTAADIITPTAINHSAIERDLLVLAQSSAGDDEEQLRLRLEMLIRVYDPCISCAVHFVRL